ALTFDDEGAERSISEFGYDSSMGLLVTADNELYHPENYLIKNIDVSIIASFGDFAAHYNRRQAVKLLEKNGISVFAGSTNDVSQIRSVYSRSKIAINHATDVGQDFGYGFGYQCRHFEVGFTKTCFLSNTIINENKQGGPKFFWRYKSEADLLEKVTFLLSSESARTSQAELFYEELNRYHLPEHRAQQIIDFVKTL
ncbi:glycosyltransferase, partial [Candidatus Pacearchaeota archaeon]|nr:glycosyltransferase [Candidatus Pacearchaeota archaeon]